MTPQQRRDVGMQRVAKRAGSEWIEQAVCFIAGYSMLHDRFLTEHVRVHSHKYGLPKPPNEKAWGPAMLMPSKEMK